jgi:hypothetical protein
MSFIILLPPFHFLFLFSVHYIPEREKSRGANNKKQKLSKIIIKNAIKKERHKNLLQEDQSPESQKKRPFQKRGTGQQD